MVIISVEKLFFLTLYELFFSVLSDVDQIDGIGEGELF